MEDKQAKKLTKKQEVFISEYLSSFNATKAAIAAGYSEDSARFQGSKLLADSNISQQIQSRMAEVHMSAEEALKLQADIARGDITDLLTPLGHVDIDAIRDAGRGKLIKKIKQRTITKIGKGEKDDDTEIHETEIELYPADVAQERILKVAGKFKDAGPTVNINMTWKDFVNGADNTDASPK